MRYQKVHCCKYNEFFYISYRKIEAIFFVFFFYIVLRTRIFISTYFSILKIIGACPMIAGVYYGWIIDNNNIVFYWVTSKLKINWLPHVRI